MQHGNTTGQERPDQDWAQYADMPVGDILRRTRLYYNLKIEDVEGALRIRASQLTAIEEGQIDRLPGRVYAIGFVRAYAEFLGLDGDKIVHLFKAQMIGNKTRPELTFPVPASESKLPGRLILAASFAGVLAVAVAVTLAQGPKRKSEVPPVPAEMKEKVATLGPPLPSAEQLAAIEPSAAGPYGPFLPESRVTINVEESAWVEIRNAGGKAILSRILKPGDSYIVPNEEGMIMDTGNVGALELVVDGRKIAKLGEPGDVRRGVLLDPEKLKVKPEVESGGVDVMFESVVNDENQ